MYRVANQVQREAQRHNCILRVDLLTVRLHNQKPKIRHYKAILPFKQRKKTTLF